MKAPSSLTRPVKRERRSLGGLLLALTFLTSSLLPGAMVVAAPQIFTRPGAGVSNLPLHVAAFADPQFGDISDAVNVATGNVYFDLGQVNRNNTLTGTDDQANTFGNFHVNGVMRLSGFNRDNPTQPAEWSLGLGDGSYETYKRVVQNGTTAQCVDNRADVIGVVNNGSTNKLEVHVLNGANNYQSFINQQASNTWYSTNNVYRFADWDHDGIPDLFLIQRGVTGSAKTEVHIMSGASGYKNSIFDIGTALGQTDSNWDFQVADWNGDGIPDVIGMPRQGTGTSSTELHVLNGANNFQSYLAQTGTVFPNLDPLKTSFHFADIDGDGKLDMIGIYSRPGQTSTEVHVASGASGYHQFIMETNTPLELSSGNWDFSIADWNKDGHPDLIAVKKNNTGTAKTEVHVLNGATNFQNFINDTGTALGQVGNADWIFQAGDYPSACTAQAYDFNTAPTWINERYSPLQGSVNYYITKPVAGVQSDETWLVTYRLPNGRTIAQRYGRDGQRTTFFANGEYADSTQDLYQQYRGAKYLNDPDGLNPGTPKTAFSYTAAGNGHLSKVRDEWGRTTVYEWNDALNRVDAVDMLLQNETDKTTWMRRVEYAYETIGGQQYVGYMAYRTYDALKNKIGRWMDINYMTGANGQVLLASIGRPYAFNGVDGNNGPMRYTSYGYDGQNRVSVVSTPGEKTMNFTYGTWNEGPQVTQTQGDKRTVFQYSADGWLRNQIVRDSNQVANTKYDRDRQTQYWYDPSGRVLALNLPTGEQQQYIYDAHGNLKQESVYYGARAWADPAPAGYTRTKTYVYDRDNQLSNSTVPAMSGTASHPWDSTEQASYSYGKITTPQPRGYFTALSNNQQFQALSQHNDDLAVNDGWISATNDFFDEQGRLTTHKTFAAGEATKTTTYSYKDGNVNNRVVYIQPDGGWSASENVRSYGDQVANQNIDGVSKTYNYDQYGNVDWILEPEAFVSSWNGSASTKRMRETVNAYNGFGQQVFQQLITQDGAGHDYNWDEGKKYWSYYSTGELDYSWEGTPNKVTDYQYADGSTAQPGYLIKVVSGQGGNGNVGIVRKSITLGYDDYGRVNSSATDGYGATITEYDTLDHPAHVTLPDGTEFKREYRSSTSDLYYEYKKDGKTGVEACVYHDYDALGQNFRTLYCNAGNVDTVFDPYGRPIRVQDNRLTMLTAGNDRASYFQYDDRGNLVKKLGPALTTAAGQRYTDARRPYAEYKYDFYNRLRIQNVLLSGGTVSPSNMAFPSGAAFAYTATDYDLFDRPTHVSDPVGYTSDTTYDNDGNAVTSVRQVWHGDEADYGTANSGFNSITTRAAFNGTGKPVQSVDARGNSQRLVYNAYGDVTMQVDQRNVVTKINWYNLDGALDSVWEPKLNNNGSTGPTYGSFNYGDFGQFVATEQDLYGNNLSQPKTVKRSVKDSSADASQGITDYTYDYAGRPISIVLPADKQGNRATVSRDYNADGQLLSETDQNGFNITYAYNGLGQLTYKHEWARTNNAVDSSAGLGSGLHSNYSYDGAGNLTQKTEHQLTTSYQYNSLGKVIAESRLHASALGDEYWKLSTYRLDGLATAKTSYDYDGNLKDHPDVGGAYASSLTSTAGNITVMEYNARGDQWAEVSSGSGYATESAWWQYVNGLGMRYKRVFNAPDTHIYAEQRAADGTGLGTANYLTYWKADPNGNLLEKWDTPQGGNGWTPRDATDQQNDYKYTYTPTNHELSQLRKIQVTVNGTVLASSTSPSPASVNSVDNTYNERDLLRTVAVNDQLPLGETNDVPSATVNKVTVYDYYADGRSSTTTSKNSDGSGVKTKTVDYDNRGREVTVTTDQGVTSTTWGPDGKRSDVVKNGGNTVYSTDFIPTVGGLYAQNADRSKYNVYDSRGLVVQSEPMYLASGSNSPEGYSYNNYGQLISKYQVAKPAVVAYSAAYNTAGTLTSEYNGPTKANDTVTYTLDSRGKRLSFYAVDSNSGAKRYNAEDMASRITVVNVRYDDFRYDPYGHQALSSVGGITNSGYPGDYSVARDVSSSVYVNGQIQYVFRKGGAQGQTTTEHEREGHATTYTVTHFNTYTPNAIIAKDGTYSLAIGYNDPIVYTGVAEFALPRTQVAVLQAPVTALSTKLRINPQDVKSGSGLPRVADPAKVGQGISDAPGAAASAATVKISPATPVSGSLSAGSALVPVDSVQLTQTQAVSNISTQDVTTLGVQTLVDPSKVQVAPSLPLTDPSAVTNASAGSKPVTDISPSSGSSTRTQTPKGTVLLTEVAPDFKDGTGFRFPVYAQDVRTMGTQTLYAGDGGSVNSSLPAQSTQTTAAATTTTGGMTPQDSSGLTNTQQTTAGSGTSGGSTLGFSATYNNNLAPAIASSPYISTPGKNTILSNSGSTYIPYSDLPINRPDQSGLSVSKEPGFSAIGSVNNAIAQQLFLDSLPPEVKAQMAREGIIIPLYPALADAAPKIGPYLPNDWVIHDYPPISDSPPPLEPVGYTWSPVKFGVYGIALYILMGSSGGEDSRWSQNALRSKFDQATDQRRKDLDFVYARCKSEGECGLGARPQDFGYSPSSLPSTIFLDGIPSSLVPKDYPNNDNYYPGFSVNTTIMGVPINGKIFGLPMEFINKNPLLGIIADGKDISSEATAGFGHMTLYPRIPMTLGTFQSLINLAPWQYRCTKKGSVCQ